MILVIERMKMNNKQELWLVINPHNVKLWVIILQYTFLLLGAVILTVCIYLGENPFPYANYVSIFLIAIYLTLMVLTDKTPWPKEKPRGDEFNTNCGP